MYICIFGFKGASTSQVIGVRNEMMMNDYDGQMIFGDIVGLKLPDNRLTGEEKPRKNLIQETWPDQGSNQGPLLTSAHATTCSTAVDSCIMGGSPGDVSEEPVTYEKRKKG